MSLRRKKKNKNNELTIESDKQMVSAGALPPSVSGSLGRVSMRNGSPSSKHSTSSDHSSNTSSLGKKSRKKKNDDIEMGIKYVEVVNENETIHTVEVLKRPGQTLGFYIRECAPKSNKRGVFISRIGEGSVVQQNGLLKVGDEIQAINSVDVTNTNLDDVVVLMSIPKKLILTIKTRRPPQRNSGSSCSGYSDGKPVYIQKQLSDDTESVRRYRAPMDLNTEDSNDSGLSSEHSLRGEQFMELPSSTPAQSRRAVAPDLPPELIYARPKSSKTELYSSDCEHEYNPRSMVPHSRNGESATSHDIKNRSKINGDAYNSDSELLPKHHNHTGSSRSRIQWSQPNHSATMNDNSYTAPNPPVFSSEMKHWLQKFDHISDNLKGGSLPTTPAVRQNSGI